jgi:hypothetical protein
MSEKRLEFLGVDKNLYLQSIILFLCIYAGLYYGYFFLVVLMINSYTLIACKPKNTYYQLFFLLPFAMVYKLSPASTSLFAYFMILSAVFMVFRLRNFWKRFILLMVLLILFMFPGVGNDYTLAIKIVSGFVLLYCFIRTVEIKDFKNYIMAFAFGLLGSSIIGQYKLEIASIGKYFTDFNREYINGIATYRFSGLYMDPNYYSIGVVIVLYTSMLLLLHKKVSKLLLVPLIAVLTYFAFLTYSKIFIVALILLFAVFVCYMLGDPKKAVITILGMGILLVIGYYKISDSDYFIGILGRFQAEDISNNRFTIWFNYLHYFNKSLKTIFLGDGIGAAYYMGKGPHNSYLELVYFLGLIGSFIYLFLLGSILHLRQLLNPKTIMNYMLLVIFCIMIATLGIFKVNDIMFYFMLIWISMNYDTRTYK